MRNPRIDLLRFIGLSAIILAHVDPPSIIFTFRNFDVPLMVVVSGLAYSCSSKNVTYLAYFWGRIERLVLPVWIFVTFYFLGLWLSGHSGNFLTMRKILETYTLVGGIGYVWIIRVFLVVALLSPLVMKFVRGTKSEWMFFLLVGLAFLVYEFLLWTPVFHLKGPLFSLFGLFFYYGFVYAIIFAVGARLGRMTKIATIVVSGTAFAVFGAISFYLLDAEGELFPIQNFKYPPSLYYYSYGIFVSMILWLGSEKLERGLASIKTLRRVIMFIASHTIWIYLWHIPLINLLAGKHSLWTCWSTGFFHPGSRFGFVVEYCLIYSIAVVITALQHVLVTKSVIPRFRSTKVKKNLRTIFIG
jgi:Acyltransferase family